MMSKNKPSLLRRFIPEEKGKEESKRLRRVESNVQKEVVVYNTGKGIRKVKEDNGKRKEVGSNRKEESNRKEVMVKGKGSKVNREVNREVNRDVKEDKGRDRDVKEVVVKHQYTSKNLAFVDSLGPDYTSVLPPTGYGPNKLKQLGHRRIAQALIDSQGRIGAAARSLHISHHILKRYIDKNADMIRILNSFKELELEYVEERFMEQIKGGNLGALIFYLKCHGKEKGWVEQLREKQKSPPALTFKYQLVLPGSTPRSLPRSSKTITIEADPGANDD